MMPLELVETALAERGCLPHRRGDHLDALCPAHDDVNPSLSVDIGTDDRVLVRCHAGCVFADIVGALGLEAADLFPGQPREFGRPGRDVVATYPYVDAGGTLLYEVVRSVPKDFRQRRPDGAGGWVWNLKGVERVPYRLPEVIAGASAGRWVLVVEGEKDVENLRQLGFVATCNAGGAGKWLSGWAEHFAGARVAILPDNDEPGRQHAELVARSLAEVVTEVRILALPGLAEHGDVSDWLAHGGTPDALKRLIVEAPPWTGSNGPARTDAGPPTHDATPAVGWGDPVPLPAARDCVAFPAHVLGDQAAQFCDAVATETGTPVDLPAVATLGTVSAVIAGAVVVEGRVGWQEPVNLYLNLLAAPGEGKTPAMRKVVRPLDLIEKERRERVEAVRLEAVARLRIAEARLKQLEAAAAKAGATDRDERTEEALAAAREVAGIVVPAHPRIYTREATPEALVRLLADQGGRIAVVTDEGSEFYELAARYSGNGKGNVGIYVDGFDGKRHLSDRAGREPIVIERATLTVLLFGQPVVLRDLAGDAQMSGRGVLARFCWSKPPTNVGRRPIHRRPVEQWMADEWAELVRTLARQAEANTEPAVLRLEAGAKHAWDAWRERHEPRLRSDVGDLAPVVEWASKLPGQVLRFAGVLHALRTGRLDGSISAGTMTAALELADYFTDHARVIFALMGSDRGLDDARLMLRWVAARDDADFTTRDVCRSKDWDAERVRTALEVLAEYGWVRQLPREANVGRPSERWERHPEASRQNPTESPSESVLSGSVRQNAGSRIQDRADDDVSEEDQGRLWAIVEALPDDSPAWEVLDQRQVLGRTDLSRSEYESVLELVEAASQAPKDAKEATAC